MVFLKMEPPGIRQVVPTEAVMTAITVETPEALMLHAIEGRLSKHALTTLLTPLSRPAFLRACATIELRLTDACGAGGDPCLESGCSCEGEICLEPTLRAGTDYLHACAAEWVKFFADAQNRDRAWRRTAADYVLGADLG
jgi:hypothetical protein